jgi:3-deoxy-D-manno-octulosonate 8-phosphate phosphatase (KDO 8-P phosphatase)
VSSEPLFSAALLERAARIKLLGLDVDGTLTDGRIWIGPEGETQKAFHVHDGQGLKLLTDAGIAVAWITARRSAIVERRAAELGISSKAEALRRHCSELGIAPEQAAFMGDDLPDRPALRIAGLAVAPANAHPWVAAVAHLQTQSRGGEGAVRELCDLLLIAQGQRDVLLRKYDA